MRRFAQRREAVVSVSKRAATWGRPYNGLWTQMLRLAQQNSDCLWGRGAVGVSKRAATWGRPYDSIRTEKLRLAQQDADCSLGGGGV